MVGVGLTAPMASMMLMHYGVAQTAPALTYKPTKRGGGGTLKVLWWQGAVHLQSALRRRHQGPGRTPHLLRAARRLGHRRQPDPDPGGRGPVPRQRRRVGRRRSGHLEAQARRELARRQADFTADDVVFTAQYAGDPATATVTVGTYKDIKVEKIDSHTVRVDFPQADAVLGRAVRRPLGGMILPKHVFEPYIGAKSRENPANIKPVGTGPYKFVDFKPGDMLRAEANTNYHVPNQPFFDALEMKGGGDATQRRARGAADRRVRLRLEPGGRGRDPQAPGRARQGQAGRPDPGSDIEFISLNVTDPWTEVDGERASAKSKHSGVQRQGGARGDGAAGRPQGHRRTSSTAAARVATANFLNNPPRFRSSNTRYEFNVDKANQVLEAAGWKKGADGIRGQGQHEAEVRVPDLA